MSHPAFSVSHPLFMVYHGFVDYMGEQYLRNAKKNDQFNEAFQSLDRFLKARIRNVGGKRSRERAHAVFFDAYYDLHST